MHKLIVASSPCPNSSHLTAYMGQMTHFLFSSFISIILGIVLYAIMNLSFVFSPYPTIDAGLLNIPISNLIYYIICEEQMQKWYTSSLEKKCI